MSRDEEKLIKRLETLGAAAAILLILAAAGAFLVPNITEHLMALAVGCGIVVNAVLTVLGFYRKQTVRSVIFLVLTLLLIAVFIMQLLRMEG